MTKKPLKKLAAVFALITLAGCSNSTETVTESTAAATTDSVVTDLPVIAVTYSIIGDIVSQLVGDNATVNVVIPDGQDPHDFQPSAKDIETINNAALVVSNGLEFEEGLEEVLENIADSGGNIFMIGEHITVRKIEEGDQDDEDHAEEEGDEQDEQRQPGQVQARTETEQFEALMMYVLVGGLMLFMFFIIWDLAKKSKAGRLGTAILFLGLGLCLFAFLAKPIITYIIETARGIHG